VLRRTFKYRLYPTRRQQRLLFEQLRFTRELYNAALEQRITAFNVTGLPISYLRQSKELTRLRAECPAWLPPGMSRSAQQYALRRLDQAFQGFFRRLRRGEKPGFPRFKSAARWDTLSAQYDKGCRLRDDISRVYWAGVGNVKLKMHRPIPEVAERKKVDLKRHGNHWYVCVEVLMPRPEPLPAVGRNVGVDLGITNFAALSTGELFAGPRAQRQAEQRVAELARQLARKMVGSGRRGKAVAALARARRKEARVRRDHHFKLACRLTRDFDLICLEDLQVKALADSYLSKDVRDAAWRQFIDILTDKAEEAGRIVVLVDPRNSSQTCSDCGRLPAERKKLSARMHECRECGLRLDRDVNAARNILRLGESQQRLNGCEVHLARAA
jgi:putative transposase